VGECVRERSDGLKNADITAIRWSGSTVAGAKRWAAKQLAA
jgi:hypothetical protein